MWLIEVGVFQKPQLHKHFNVWHHKMKTLQNKILSYDNWAQPWKFYEFILADNEMSLTDSELFKEIWKKASDFNLWKNGDLTIGTEASHRFIKDNYHLSDETVIPIVRAISYQWK